MGSGRNAWMARYRGSRQSKCGRANYHRHRGMIGTGVENQQPAWRVAYQAFRRMLNTVAQFSHTTLYRNFKTNPAVDALQGTP